MDESKHIKINEQKWDKWAHEADSKGLKYDYLRRIQNGVLDLLDLKQNINFLDIGCGTGWAVGQAAKRIDYKGSFFGVDLSQKMIEKAKDNFNDYTNFHFINANSESIPLENNQFDIIICTNSFHHYLHPDKVIREMSRLLKIGGKIFILDPTADSWAAKIVDKVIRLTEPTHVKMHSTNEFKALFYSADLMYVVSKKIYYLEKVHIGQKEK